MHTPLHRSRTEGVVEFAEDVAEQTKHTMTRNLSLPGTLSHSKRVNGHELAMITFGKARQPAMRRVETIPTDLAAPLLPRP
jgi:hypothetical protein